MKKRAAKKPLALTIPSAVAVSSFQRGGAGKHGGSDRLRNRRDRQTTRQQLRREDF